MMDSPEQVVPSEIDPHTSRLVSGNNSRVTPFAALKKFFVSTHHGLPPVDDPFVEVDQDGIVASLRLVERGGERGRLNQPAYQNSRLDVVEHEIVNLIGSELNRAQISARVQSQAYENRLAHLHLIHEVGAIRAETVKATGDFNALVIDWRNKLTPRRDAICESYHDLRRFKAENRLERPAHEKPPGVVTIGSIAFSALAEIIGNAFFLRVNDDLGYLGGLIAAIMVALINVGIAALMGWLVWPRTQLRDASQRLLARVLIVGWLAFVIAWNLFAAHFRDAKASGLPDAQSAAVKSLMESPVGLDGLFSWGLFIIGIVAALFTAWSAYNSDDPFPGYGERVRQHNSRCEEYADGVGAAIKHITATRDDAIDGACAVKEVLNRQLRERESIHNAFKRFSVRYDQYQTRLQDVSNSLLATYRDANICSRTEPAPAYFNERYTVQRSQLDALHDVKVREEDIAEANHALGNCIEELGREFDRAINSFESLEELKSELERGSL